MRARACVPWRSSGPPAALLAVFFLTPMIVMLVIALQYGVLERQRGLDAHQLRRRARRPALPRRRADHVPDRHHRDDHPAGDRDPAGLRARLQGGEVRARAAALPGARRRAQPDGPHLRLADAARPRGPDQLVPDGDRADQRADRRAAVQQVRGHRRALHQLPDLHGDPDLRGDEGDRPEHLRGRRSTSARAGSRPRGAC